MGIKALSKALVIWPTDDGVDAGGHFNVFADGDYVNRINAIEMPAWPDGINADGPGDGHGADGLGDDGRGAELHEFVSGQYRDGSHSFAVIGYDAAGNSQSPPTATGQVDLAGTPRGATSLAAAWVMFQQIVKFTWTLSVDDGL